MTTDELLEERGKTHGRWEDHAIATQSMKAAAHAAPGWQSMPYQACEAVDMILHKIGRIVAGQDTWEHTDHWADIAGYARLAELEILKSK